MARARARSTPARCWPPSTARRIGDAGQHAAGAGRRRAGRRLGVAVASARPVLPGGARARRRRSTCYGSALWEHGRGDAPVAGSMAVARTLAPPGRARARPVRRARGQDDPPRGADGRRGRAGRGRGPRRSRPGAARHAARAWAPRSVDGSRWPTPASPPAGGRFDRVLVDPPCSGLGTLQSRPDLRWQARPARSRAGRQAGRAAGRRRRGAPRPAARSSTRSARSPVPKAMASIDGVPRRRTRSSSCEERCASCCPHRDGTDGFFIARLARR